MLRALSKHHSSLGCMLHLQAKAVLDWYWYLPNVFTNSAGNGNKSILNTSQKQKTAEIWAALFAWNCMLLNNSMDMWRKCSVSWFIIYSVVESRCYAMTSLSLPCFVNKKSAKILSKTWAWKQYFSAAASCLVYVFRGCKTPFRSQTHPFHTHCRALQCHASLL